MIRITYTEDAAQDLEEIYRHIALDNLDAAQKHRQKQAQLFYRSQDEECFQKQ